MTEWPFILELSPLKGSVNMAVDEALFRGLGAEPRTCLRFYAWEKPTVSLGCGQSAEEAVNIEACRELGVDIVRRITGGKLVLHHRELTYSLCSSDTGIFSATLRTSYRLISQGLIRGLERLDLDAALAADTPQFYKRGLHPCFASPAADEVECRGRKIVGSAQKRVGDLFLQHGSIPLRDTTGLLRAVSRSAPGGKAPGPAGLDGILGRAVAFEELAGHLAAGLSDFFRVRLAPASLSASEMAEADRIRRERYDNDDWTFRKVEPPGLIFPG